jgi:hypothetical protein
MGTVETARQAGDKPSELKRFFPGLQVPEGPTLEHLENAEYMVLDWEREGHSRALELVVKVYEYLLAASQSSRVPQI